MMCLFVKYAFAEYTLNHLSNNKYYLKNKAGATIEITDKNLYEIFDKLFKETV